MSISAKAVSELRKATGAGMMDCKKALQESDGDIDGAIDWLRKKGQAAAAKRADREANEGVVVAVTNDDNTKAAVVALGCETDFVAKNEDFIAFANDVAKLALEKSPADKEGLAQLELDGKTIAERLIERTGTIGEKLQITDCQIIAGDNISTYIHSGAKIGVAVSYKSSHDDASQFFRSVAMHIAAMNPRIMRPEEFDLEFVQKETEALQGAIKVDNEDRERLGKPLRNVPTFGSRLQLTPEVMAQAEEDIKAQLKEEGKPEQIWDKIVPGKLERFVADNTLLDQEHCLLSQFFALDDSKRVEDAIAELGDDTELIEFKRVAVG